MGRNKGIILFAVLFCVAVLSPLAVNAFAASPAPEVSLDTPAINEMENKECVASTDYMRSSHMQLLDEWRTQVVRQGATDYTSPSGQVYDMSLDNTCLSCHENREEFCDSCHEYAGVNLYCWECHDGSPA